MHTLSEVSNAFAQAAHDFRDFLSAKEQNDDGQYNQPMNWAHFTHGAPAFRVSVSGDK